ncbi:MAG: DNA internalization-related competence protein ComEC/Rec2 [Phycisphaerae bacterium]|nr:DNA internalization-related competence protein ComEC/Rec2 [Phycisphaerae bacterium]
MKRRSFDETDLIRLNLQRLDAETRTQPLLHKTFTTAPILPFAIAFLIGIIIADNLPSIRYLWSILISAILLNGIVLICCIPANANTRLRLALIGSCSIVLTLGMMRYYTLIDIPPDHIGRYFDTERELATLEGTVISPIRTDQQRTGLSSIPWLNSKSSFYLETTHLNTADGRQKTTGKVRVQTDEPIAHVQPGNTVRITCWLSRFSPSPNPGQFDLSRYMAQRGVTIAASVPLKEGVEVIDGAPSFLSKARSALYRLTSASLLDESVTDTDVRAMVSALLLGRRSSVNPHVMAAFRDTNLAHFISLSGMHVGILAGSLWLVLRMTGLPKRPRAVLCIVLILLYAMVVPPRAPTLRAVFLSCFFFASVLFRQQANPLNTLALSAMALLFFRPYELFSAGWQLSFMSVLGILLFYPAVRYQLLVRLFYPLVPYLKRFIAAQHFLHGVIELLAIGVSIWLTIAPILLYYFGRINPLSPLWTIIALPFVLAILYAGFLKILLSGIIPTLAAVFGWILNLAARGLERLVVLLSKIDFVQIVSYRPRLSLVLFIYLLILAICLLPHRYRLARKVVFGLMVVCFLFPGISRHIDIKNRNTLEMTCLSVGHGQCIVLSGPNNEHILFDAGSITNKNIAHKTIFPYLQHQSIFSLDTVYLSHGDLDHINAVGDLVAYVNVKNICANHILLQTAQTPSVEKELYDGLIRAGHELTSTRNYTGPKGLAIQSIWPGDEIVKDSSVSENDKSEVLLIRYANRQILLCGDIERQAQQQLMGLYPDMTVDVLVLPHHGSTNNLDNGFVEHLNPAVVIASGSQRNMTNTYQPAAGSGMQIFHTAKDGAVSIKIKTDGTLSAAGYLNPENSLGQRPNP